MASRIPLLEPAPAPVALPHLVKAQSRQKALGASLLQLDLNPWDISREGLLSSVEFTRVAIRRYSQFAKGFGLLLLIAEVDQVRSRGRPGAIHASVSASRRRDR